MPKIIRTVKGLNPYYTGIHLHYNSKGNLEDAICLNPYYTGIHLHGKIGYEAEVNPAVLILIILEYIYIFSDGSVACGGKAS